jgi:ketosteroid isomerase-like protein
MRWFGGLALFWVVFAFGCAPQPQALSEADEAAIRAHLDKIAQHDSPEDNAAWANDFIPDGIFMIEGSPILRGRAAIQQRGETNERVASVTFSNIDIRGSGDTAWVTGAQSPLLEGQTTPQIGEFLGVVQRQADGSWLTAAASVSSDSPPPAN